MSPEMCQVYLLKRLTAAAGARPASHRPLLSGKLERRGEITAKDEERLMKTADNSVMQGIWYGSTRSQ